MPAFLPASSAESPSPPSAPQPATDAAAPPVPAPVGCAHSAADMALGLPAVGQALAAFAASPAGKARALALPRCVDAAAVRLQLNRVLEAFRALDEGLLLPAGPPHAILPLLAQVQRGAALSGPELVQVAAVAQALLALCHFGTHEAQRFVALATLAAPLAPYKAGLGQLATLLRQSLRPDGTLADDASAGLARERQRARVLEEALRATMDALLQDPEVAPHLQDDFVALRNGRYVLPVVASFASKVPGIVHDTSQSGQTFFIEPLALVADGNRAVVQRARVAEEERRLLLLLGQEVGAQTTALACGVAALVELDVVLASALFARRYGFVVPEQGAANEPVHLEALAHPELCLGGGAVVRNDVRLAAAPSGLLISGPNAGGKTVLLKAVGLCQRMLWAGLPVPVKRGSRVPLFDALYVELGDGQNVAAGESSFSAHVRALARVAQRAGPGALVLLDEVGKDTDPAQGAALARAVLEHLLAAGATVVATTHLEALKVLSLTDGRFLNGRMATDAALRPSHRFIPGVSGESHAFALAAQVGMPANIVAAAERYHGGQQTEAAAALVKLAAEEQRLAALQAELDARLRAAEQAAERARTEQAAALQRQELARAADKRALAAELERAAATLHRHLQQTASADAQQTASAQVADWQRSAALGRRQAQGLQAAAALQVAQDPAGPPAAPGPVQVGSQVWVPSLARQGEVVALADKTATVLLGTLRSRVPVAALRLLPQGPARSALPGAQPPTQKHTRLVRAPAATGDLASRDGAEAALHSARVDIRGLRAEQAAHLLVRAFDLALSEGRRMVWVVHGHGTGALREVVREVVGRSPYVQDLQPGDSHEGGDGVSKVFFDA